MYVHLVHAYCPVEVRRGHQDPLELKVMDTITGSYCKPQCGGWDSNPDPSHKNRKCSSPLSKLTSPQDTSFKMSQRSQACCCMLVISAIEGWGGTTATKSKRGWSIVSSKSARGIKWDLVINQKIKIKFKMLQKEYFDQKWILTVRE